MSVCVVDGCDRTLVAQGFCESHYRKWKRWGDPTPPTGAGGRGVRSTSDRFWRNVVKTDGCWLWTGTLYRNGYGNLWDPARGRKVLVHRLSYEMHHGAIPKGLLVCHACDVRNCVRPDHLWLGTCADNLGDMAAKGRRRKTHCIHGHPLGGSNLYVDPRGRRVCKQCVADAQRRYLQRRRRSQ